MSFDNGCGLTLRGQMWYFGGRDAYNRQVSSKPILQIEINYLKKSKIVGCQMVRQEDDLPFEFSGGSCNTFWNPILNLADMLTPEEKALLCFGFGDRKQCHL